jgi:hypothetical protein
MDSLSESDEAALEASMPPQPMDMAAAPGVLLEAKQILDELGVVFYLEEGTCLGAIREHGIIPWDDDIDFASIFGLNGLNEKAVDGIVAKYREHGFITKMVRQAQAVYVPALKSGIRVDWHGRWIIDGSTYTYPGVRIPAELFQDLKEIDFLGERFLVPNPPEEFLRMKYGPDWMTPKQTDYVADVVNLISETPAPEHGSRLVRLLKTRLMPWRATKLRVLDRQGQPVADAEVTVTGVNRSRTDSEGYVRFQVMRNWIYAVVIKYEGHEEVLYEERLGPGATYVYRADAATTSGRYFVLSPQ